MFICVPPRKEPVDNSVERVIAYLRVSTDEQGDSGAGLAAQKTAITADVARRGWTITNSYVDIASGKSRAKRLGLAYAMEEIKQGYAGTLMVSKLDRLSRSLIDFTAIMNDARQHGWNLVALDLGVDLSTPAGEFLANVMASAAQWERRIIGQRTRDAMAEKKSAGVILGKPPASPEVVLRILAARRKGASYQRIATQLNDEGVPTTTGGRSWYAATVRKIALSDNAQRLAVGES